MAASIRPLTSLLHLSHPAFNHIPHHICQPFGQLVEADSRVILTELTDHAGDAALDDHVGHHPQPSNNIRLAVAWMQYYADDMPYHVMGTVIPALGVALDGALCQFLLDTLDDPVCHAVFDRINDDESRHLGVGFTVMEMHGHSPQSIEAVRMMGRLLKPQVLLGLAVHFPLLNKVRDNVVKAGLPEEKLYAAMAKFEKIGGRTGRSRKNLLFRAISGHNKMTDLIPHWALPAKPSWVGDVTWKPTD